MARPRGPPLPFGMRLLLAALLLPAALGAQTLAPRPVLADRTGSFQDPALTESSGVIRVLLD